MQKKCILFDFDGVIVDSFEAAFAVTQVVYPWITRDEYRDFFMGNVYKSLEHVRKTEARPVNVLSDEEYFKRYALLSAEMQPVAGISNVITQLAQRHSLSIVSSAYNYIIEDILDRAGIRDKFTDILGADIEKNKTTKIVRYMEKYGFAPHESMFVTDTVGDIKEAREVGVDAIAVSWGYHEEFRLVAANPLAIVNTPEELLNSFI